MLMYHSQYLACPVDSVPGECWAVENDCYIEVGEHDYSKRGHIRAEEWSP